MNFKYCNCLKLFYLPSSQYLFFLDNEKEGRSIQKISEANQYEEVNSSLSSVPIQILIIILYINLLKLNKTFVTIIKHRIKINIKNYFLKNIQYILY